MVLACALRGHTSSSFWSRDRRDSTSGCPWARHPLARTDIRRRRVTSSAERQEFPQASRERLLRRARQASLFELSYASPQMTRYFRVKLSRETWVAMRPNLERARA